MSIIIIFGIILAIAYALDENKRRNKELEYAEELSEKGYTKNYMVENHYHSEKDINLEENYEFNKAKIIDVEIEK